MKLTPVKGLLISDNSPAAPAGNPSKNASNKDPIFAVKKLIMEDCLYELALPLLARLLDQRPNEPELWMLMAVAAKQVGHQVLQKKFTVKFNAWFSQNERNPKAIIAALFFLYKTFATREALALVDKTFADKKLLSRFTPIQQKWLFILAAELRDDYVLTDFSEARASLKLGEELVQRALAIRLSHQTVEGEYLNYRAHYLQGRFFASLSLYANNEREAESALRAALLAYGEAIKLDPTAPRPCLDWQDLRKKEQGLPAPPPTCDQFW